MRRITLSSVALWPYHVLSHYPPPKRNDFHKEAIEHIMCVLIFSTPFV